MEEREFIKKLNSRAKEQENLVKGVLFPKAFIAISLWFGNHPLQLIIPIALLITILLRGLFGNYYYDLILSVFGSI